MGSKQPSDAFLPSGALGDVNQSCPPSDSVSPRSLVPEYIPQLLHGGSRISPPKPQTSSAPSQSLSYFPPREKVHSPESLTPSHSQNGPPISPPVSRSASRDGNNIAIVEYWRLHARKIREQAHGERAHMLADRARADEVMEEERALWEEERQILKARITQLEAQLEGFRGQKGTQLLQRDSLSSPSNRSTGGTPLGAPTRPLPQVTTSSSVSGSIDGTSAKVVPQESGRNPDGSVFYAPASRNPSRTFEQSESNNLRVENMVAPRETPLRVTSRELTASDFSVTSPPAAEQSREGSTTGEVSIDISHIQPELEGIPLKASAVAPEFVAKVISPSMSLSPSMTASGIISPPQSRDVTNSHDGSHRLGLQGRKTSTMEVIAAPENRRLTMHAGHTPNHSITKFDIAESGSATPTQSHPLEEQSDKHVEHTSLAPDEPEQFDGHIDEDIPLKGPLGLKNEPAKDAQFLSTLMSKLNEVRESGQLSPSEASITGEEVQDTISTVAEEATLSVDKNDKDEDDSSDRAIDEGPRLRVKPSINFGRPFGSL